jgi:hypothetical protein
MSTLITRFYEAYGDALSAVNELKRNKFGDAVQLISLAPNDAAASETLEDRILKAGVPQADVAAFAAAVRQGHSLIVVKAVMGVALKATAILNAHKPIKHSNTQAKPPILVLAGAAAKQSEKKANARAGKGR